MPDDTAIPFDGPPSLNATIGATAIPFPTGDVRGTIVGLGPVRSFSDTQRRIAFMLLWIMIGVIAIITIVALGYSLRCSLDGGTCGTGASALDLLNKSLSPIFTAMIGLVGSVVGFYFGSKQSGS